MLPLQQRSLLLLPLLPLLLCCTPTLWAEALPSAQTGIASYYSDRFQGRRTASGEPYRKQQLTAAHRRLPMGSVVRVTRLDNRRSVEVRINDRGPRSRRRIIDLSRRAAQELDMIQEGLTQVKVEVVSLGD